MAIEGENPVKSPLSSSKVLNFGGLLREREFYLLLLCGPLFWLAYYIYAQPVPVLNWPLQQPGRYLLLVLVYPVLEEIVFRGLVLDAITRLTRWRIGPLTLANLIAAVIFAGFHLFYQPWYWAALIVIPALVFGYAKERFGTLLAPVILHCFYNAGFVWLFVVPK